MKPIIVILIILVLGFIGWSVARPSAPVAEQTVVPIDTTNDGGTANGTPAGPQGKLPAGSVAPGNPELLIGTWVWQQTTEGGQTITPNKPGVFAVTFSTDGRVSGKTDCNGFGGEYEVGSDGIISFGPFMSTMMYCEGSQESVFNAQMSKAKSYSWDKSGNLVIRYGDNAGSIVFKKK